MAARNKSKLKVLLLQIREDIITRKEEFDSFCKYSGLSSSQIDILNVFDTPSFASSVIDRYDALFVGGTSEANVLKPDKFPFLQDITSLFFNCIEKDFPVFASCFGFQIAILALNGHIIQDNSGFEMGTIPISLTGNSRKDPIFRDVPDKFLAVSVHQQLALESPVSCDTLAFTSRCCHAFRIRGKPFWAFQFHPEVDCQTLIKRLTVFKEQYTENDDHLNNILANVQETPVSNSLVEIFVNRVLLERDY